MNAKVKRLWLRALRGRKYKQTQGQLRRETSEGPVHCCLGVLEELAVNAGVISRYNNWQGGLDPKVKEWAGLDRTDPRLGPRSNSRTASNYNDTGSTFAQIADRIEKYL